MSGATENPHSPSAAPRLEGELAKPVTLAGGIALVVGGVIGIGIYAMIAPITISAGTSQWLAFLIAVVLSMVGVTPLMQLSSAMPRAGGGYHYTAHLLTPVMGALTSSWAVFGGACSTCVVTVGLAKYISPHLPGGIPDTVIGFGILAVFFMLYQFGLKLAMWLQIAMVAQLILALVAYAGLGAATMPISFAVEMPRGAGGFAMATILCYSVCMGFQVIAEMGEEMQHAKRNIPLSLAVGGVMVLVLYVAVGSTFASSIPYDPARIGAMKAPLSESAALFMPGPLVVFLGVGALSAGLTSLNAAAIALPRELFAQAREGVLPAWLGAVNGRTRSPLHAETAFFAVVCGLMSLNATIDYYGILAAVGILLMTVMLSIAGVRLPRAMPEAYRNAYLQIPPAVLTAVAVVAIATSLGFVLIVLWEAPSVALVYAGFSVAVVTHYRIRALRGQVAQASGGDTVTISREGQS